MNQNMDIGTSKQIIKDNEYIFLKVTTRVLLYENGLMYACNYMRVTVIKIDFTLSEPSFETCRCFSSISLSFSVVKWWLGHMTKVEEGWGGIPWFWSLFM